MAMDGVTIALVVTAVGGITAVMAGAITAGAVDALILPGAVERRVDVLPADRCSRMGSAAVDMRAVGSLRLMRPAVVDGRAADRRSLMRLRLAAEDTVAVVVMPRAAADMAVVVDMRAVVVDIAKRSRS
jgi:hypothetical protein